MVPGAMLIVVYATNITSVSLKGKLFRYHLGGFGDSLSLSGLAKAIGLEGILVSLVPFSFRKETTKSLRKRNYPRNHGKVSTREHSSPF